MGEKDGQAKALYLPASVLLASVILSAAIFMAGSEIGSSLSAVSAGLAVAQGSGNSGNSGGSGSGAGLAPEQGSGSGSGAGTQGSVQMKALLEGAAATFGDPNAPIIMVEYSDYQCPFCRSWFNSAKSQLDSEYIETGKVLFVYKDFPLSFHPMAQPYAEAARCAGEQGKYWEFHDKIFEEQNKFGSGRISNLTEQDIKDWASQLGLNTAEFNSCLDSGKYAGAVQANFSEGTQVGVSGTPSFVIGKADGTGQIIVVAQPYGTFKAAIDSLLNG